MFGQQPNTPFGGGFGQQQQQQQPNTAPAFGSPAPSAGGLFGSPPAAAFGGGGFGQPQQQQPPAATGFGGGGGFGAPPAPGLFGAPSTAQSAGSGFGGGAFGALAPAAGGLFGAPAPTAFGGFGAPVAPAPSTGLFGAQPPAPSTGLFGSSNNTQGMGGNATSAFGGGGGFGNSGAASGSLFGAPPPAPSGFGGGGGLFGAPAPAPTGFGGGFGAPAPAVATGFGAPAPVGAFGAPSTAFGVPAPATGFGTPSQSVGLFGSPPPAPASGFGAPVGGGGLFGSAPSNMASGVGTRAAPYQVTAKQDGTSHIHLQSISAMQQYQDQSPEELRFADYSQGNRGTAAAAQPTMGFGAPAPSLFGAAPAMGAFGSSTAAVAAPAFGAAPTPAFAQNSASSGGFFGQASAAAPFGAPAPSTFGGFGAPPAPSFGQPPASGGLFGAPAPAFGAPALFATGLFGSTPAASSFAPAQSTGLFGAPAAPATTFGSTGGLFGSTPAPTPGLFGQPPSAGGGLFGSSPAAPPFGQPTAAFGQAPAPFGGPTTSLFGQAPTQGFGAPPAGGLLGQPAPVPGFAMVQAAPMQQQQFQPQPLFAPNVQIIAAAVNESLEQQVRALDNQLKDAKNMEVWKGPQTSTSPASTPTGTQGLESIFQPPSGSRPVMYATPRTTKIRPRGFAQSEPAKPSMHLNRRDNSALMSPESYVRSSRLNLVIRPESLQRSRKLDLKLDIISSPSTMALPAAETIDPLPDDDNRTPLPPQRNSTVSPIVMQNGNVPSPSTQAAVGPSYDYYKQVIGNGSEEQTTCATNSTPQGRSTSAPKLTKKGYEVSPSLADLAAMSEADLASVSKFAVWRSGYGKVEWEGQVDVRGADLDKVVVIEEKDVSVYNMDEQKGTKPDVGTKLNRPAIITFHEVFPKEGPRASAEIKERYTKKVQKSSERTGAEFISYDANTGVWKIRVKHFSRYALIDDDTDDENETSPDIDTCMLPTPQKMDLSSERLATPFRPSLMILEDSEHSDGEDTEENLYALSLLDYSEETMGVEAEEAAKCISDIINFEPPGVRAKKVRLTAPVEGVESSLPSLLVKDTMPYEDEIIAALSGTMSSSRRRPKPKYGLNSFSIMRRSFRVGWLPNGSFIKLRAGTNDDLPSLEISRPVLTDDSTKSVSHSLLESQHQDAILHAEGLDNCPLFSLAGSYQRLASVLSRDKNHPFVFMARLFSLNVNDNVMSSNDGKMPHESRKIAAAFVLLFGLCAQFVQKEVEESRTNIMSVIFAAFFCGHLELACNLAMDAGLPHLAVMLSSSIDGQDDIQQLLNETAASGDLLRMADPLALRSVRNKGFDTQWESKAYVGGDKSLDWRQRLILRLLQGPDVSLSTALVQYENDVRADLVPFPSPQYFKRSTNQVTSVYFRLLRLLADPSSISVCEAINPLGYTPYSSDMYLSFHLASVISASANNNANYQITAVDAECIIDGYVTHLLGNGKWEWAVFVYLCCIGKMSPEIHRWKTLKAKCLVMRYFDRDDLQASQRRDFLERKVGIPPRWFEESQCYRDAYNGDIVSCISQACKLDLANAREAFVEFVLPRLVLEKSPAAMVKLTPMASEAPLGSIALDMHEYFKLDERVMTLTNDPGGAAWDDFAESELDVMFGVYHSLLASFSQLGDDLTKMGSQPRIVGSLFIPTAPLDSVHMSSMISAVLQRLSSIKVQLDALQIQVR